MKKFSAIVVGTVIGLASVTNAFAGGWHPQQINPATCAYLQSVYQGAGYGSPSNISCAQLTAWWYATGGQLNGSINHH